MTDEQSGPEMMEHPCDTPPGDRFLSREGCIALAKRAAAFARGGGDTRLEIESTWTGNIAWGRNQIMTSGDVRDHTITIIRDIRGAWNYAVINQLDDATVEAAVRRAERLLIGHREDSLKALPVVPYTEPYQSPTLWFDRTYQLDDVARAEAMRTLVPPAEAAGMLSAGYIEVSAHGRGAINASGQTLYYPYTLAQYSVTVRDPAGTASGWAGVDWNDWGRIDAAALSAIALEKCLRSRHAVALEPGRYETILEPQAVADLAWTIFHPDPSHPIMDRVHADTGQGPFAGARVGESKIGERVLDARITISADPMDPDCGFPPFDDGGYGDTPVYHPVTWFNQGVLRELAYDRQFSIHELGKNTGLLNSGAFHMSGGTTTVDEMIATTQRGLLVTRLSAVEIVDERSMLLTGYTRDGLWLIERGKISKAVKNFRFTESVLIALNNVLELGSPQRIFHPGAPIVVPPLKVQDFSFTSLVGSV